MVQNSQVRSFRGRTNEEVPADELRLGSHLVNRTEGRRELGISVTEGEGLNESDQGDRRERRNVTSWDSS